MGKYFEIIENNSEMYFGPCEISRMKLFTIFSKTSIENFLQSKFTPYRKAD